MGAKNIGRIIKRLLGARGTRRIISSRSIELVTPPIVPHNIELMQEIAMAFKREGGRALLVGGGVRDMFFGMEPKDLDFEIYGLAPERVKEIAKKLGKVDEVGAAFGVLHVTTPKGIGIDISLPRIDSKVAPGHKGFAVKADPFMTPVEAAKRRDFTINALAYDPLTHKVLNLYGGVEDIKNRILKVTDPERFADDPLRVLRGMQFAARYDLRVPEETKTIMRSLVPHLKEIAPERIAEEYKKLLLKGKKPSTGLSLASEIGIFDEYLPEFALLKRTPQDPLWHPEGDVMTHTLMVVDKAAGMRQRFGKEDEQLAFMLSAMFHDIGKPLTTTIKNNRIISPGHAEIGANMVPDILGKIGIKDKSILRTTQALVATHMRPQILWAEAQKGVVHKPGIFVRLAREVDPANIEMLASLAEADLQGRATTPELRTIESSISDWLRQQALRADALTAPPRTLIMGRDLIAAGYTPGPMFGAVISAAEKAREYGLTRDEALNIIRKSKSLDEAVRNLKEYSQNL